MRGKERLIAPDPAPRSAGGHVLWMTSSNTCMAYCSRVEIVSFGFIINQCRESSRIFSMIADANVLPKGEILDISEEPQEFAPTRFSTSILIC